MPVLEVRNREFQRAIGEWLEKARQGNTVVIRSPQGPPLTLQAGLPSASATYDWDEHFRWLKKQPESLTNPVDDLRSTDNR
jgi:hypothetical protein